MDEVIKDKEETKKAPTAEELATQLAELRKEKQQRCQQELTKLIASWGDFELVGIPFIRDNGTIGVQFGIAPKTQG